MDIEKLECERRKKFGIVLFTAIVFLILFIVYFGIIICFDIAPECIAMSFLFPSVLLIAYVWIICDKVLSFEYIVKINLMEKILNNIIGDNGKIAWLFKGENNAKNRFGFKTEDDIEEEFEVLTDFVDYLKLYTEPDWFGERIIPNDQFFGFYKGVKFSVSEIKFTRHDRPFWMCRVGDYIELDVFRGIVIQIEVKGKDFSPVIFKRRNSAYPIITKKFKNIPPQRLKGGKYNIYIQDKRIYQKFHSSFYEYLSSINKNISFSFIENKAIILIPTAFDMFKLGSLFKRVDDDKQYMKFKHEFQFMLNIIENLSKIINSENI